MSEVNAWNTDGSCIRYCIPSDNAGESLHVWSSISVSYTHLQGKIAEVCAEPGEYTYDTSSEPSIFAGKMCIRDSSYVGGLSGAFIPVSEDQGMIDAVTIGALTMEKLEAMTCVCSVGLDMIAIPGKTKARCV